MIVFYKSYYCSSSPFLSSSGIDPGPSVFGVMHRIHDDPAHTNQQTYSCGSLHGLQVWRGGCIDLHYHKTKEPCEEAWGVRVWYVWRLACSGYGVKVCWCCELGVYFCRFVACLSKRSTKTTVQIYGILHMQWRLVHQLKLTSYHSAICN